MPPRPITSEEYVTRLLGELIESDSEVAPFQRRRLLAEAEKIQIPARRDSFRATVESLAGQYASARHIIGHYLEATPEQLAGQGRPLVIDVAAAMHAAQRLKPSAALLRRALSAGLIPESDGAMALQVATGVCAFNLAGDIMEKMPNLPAATLDRVGSAQVVAKTRALGLCDDDVQGYVQACIEAVMPWVEGRRRCLLHTHMVIEQSNQIVIDLEVPADPDDFGDIMWAIASIDKAAYSQGVADHVLVDAVPVEEATQ